MKKILILAMFFAISSNAYLAHACPIDNPGACTPPNMKADIGIGINDKLHDKIIPDNLNKQIQPNNTLNNRTNLGQPSIPDNINMRPIQRESTQPYDANCQFGNCLNFQEAEMNKNE